MADESELPAREAMDYDVVIVGAGPAGLSAAIRLKQLNAELTVVVVEKASTVGAHILSGAVVDPIGLDRLLPDWRDDPERPLKTSVVEDRFMVLGPSGGVTLPNWPMPKLMNNHGNFIGSLGETTRWLGARAEALGVEIYPGFAAAELLFGEKGEVVGVATGDMGVGRDGKPNTHFTRGMELRGKYVLIGEGARGSLAKQLILRYGLDVGREPQKFGVGLKEVWQIDPAKFFAGRVQHSFGWPLGSGASGGSFLYHYDDRLVAVGFVVHLNYSNPSLSPYEEFQRFKIHPLIRETFVGGKRLAYGARAISSGGLQSVPKLTFPGGALIGCAAGFVNFARIKGSHNAVLKISFDKASSVFLSNTNHEEDPPIHLKLRDPAVPIRDNLPRYGEPARLYCPAGVYEVVYADETTRADPRFVINAQNCVHCKTCDIKDPAHNIDWTPPEGGGGPNYPDM